MSDKETRTLWTSEDRSNYYLIPNNVDILSGDVIIRKLNEREEKRVAPNAVAAFEVTEEVAREHIQAQVRQAFAQAGSAFSDMLSFSGLIDQGQPGNDTSKAPLNLDHIAMLLGADAQEIRRDTVTGSAGLTQLLTEIQEIFADINPQDPEKAASVSKRLDELGAKLEARGIMPKEDIKGLHETLQMWYHLLEEQQSGELAAKLHGIADQVEKSPEQLGKQIDELIARLERQFGPLLGQESKAQQEERRQKEYEASAREAIARSLRAHHIIPSVDWEKPDPDPETGKAE